MPVLRRFLPIALLILFLALPLTVHAATLNVPSQYATIQAGIDAAQNGDTVLVADGTYTGTGNRDITFSGKNITVTSVNGASKTIVDCQGTATADHFGFEFLNTETAAVLNGFTIEHGYSSSDGNSALTVGGTATISNCILQDNSMPQGDGGAILILGSLTLSNCTITRNTASEGGGVYVSGVTEGTATLTNCSLTSNSAGYGGGITNGGYLTLTNCTVSENTSDTGGGIDNGDEISLTGCTLTDNTATNGGGLFNIGSGAVLTDCIIEGNKANAGSGGGGEGGGVASLANTIIVDCVFSGNTAALGGGIYNRAASDSVLLNECTVEGNTAPSGGGVYNDDLSGLVTLADTIVYANSGGEITTTPASITYVSALYCDVQGGFVGTSNIDADPLFVNAAGGDFHLKAGSPVIGKGTVSIGNSFYSSTDKDGVVRPNPPSIGAYEYVALAAAPIISSLSPSSKLPGSSAFTLTVNGTGFLSNSVVDWNGTALTTTFVSSTKLTAFVSASLLHNAGTENITVTTPAAAASSGKAFLITPGHIGTAIALAAGADGKTRILWTNTGGAATVWTLNTDGSVASYGANYGPIPGWTATHLSVGPDNATRILWTNTNGAMTVWTLPSGGSTPTYGPVYGPYTGWSAVGIATDTADATHVLWDNADGRMTLWTLPVTGSPSYSPVFGPIAGWTAKAVATGDSAAHVLWTNTSGAMTLWTVPAGGAASYGPVYGPLTGWTAMALSVDTGGVSHVLWDNADGRMTLWTLPVTGSPSYSPVFGPYAGWSAVGLSVGASGNSHVLWDNANGTMTPWTLSAGDQFVGSFPTYGPY